MEAVTPQLLRPRLGGPSRRLLAAVGDDRLVRLVRSGHPAAFEAIFDRYSASLLSFCRHMLGSSSEAEDALQQTFLSAHRDLLASDKAIELRPWLYTIARNRSLSMLRARREHSQLLEDSASTVGLAEDVQQRDDLRAALEDLRRLPEDQREALLLLELGDLRQREIASVLGCRPEKVKALVHQARSSLMADRLAREVSCREIREELACARGHALLQSRLRRHLRVCEGCRQYAEEVRRQRQTLALLLPVAPTAALKASSLGIGHASAGAVGAGAASGGAITAWTGKALILKGLVVLGAAAGVTAASVAVTQPGRHRARVPAHRNQPASQARTASRGASGASGTLPATLQSRAHHFSLGVGAGAQSTRVTPSAPQPALVGGAPASTLTSSHSNHSQAPARHAVVHQRAASHRAAHAHHNTRHAPSSIHHGYRHQLATNAPSKPVHRHPPRSPRSTADSGSSLPPPPVDSTTSTPAATTPTTGTSTDTSVTGHGASGAPGRAKHS